MCDGGERKMEVGERGRKTERGRERWSWKERKGWKKKDVEIERA